MDGWIGCSGFRSCRSPTAFRPNNPNTVPCPSQPLPYPAPTAIHRGTPYCLPHPLNGSVFLERANCSREALSLLSQERPDLLNVSLTNPTDLVKVTAAPVPHDEFAKYRWVFFIVRYTNGVYSTCEGSVRDGGDGFMAHTMDPPTHPPIGTS